MWYDRRRNVSRKCEFLPYVATAGSGERIYSVILRTSVPIRLEGVLLMRIALLAPASVIHTVQWANRLARRGLSVHVISIHEPVEEFDSTVSLHVLPYRPPVGYVTAARAVRELLGHLKPNVVNAHYATGYGTLARLVGFKPLLLSVWGSDVYDFPRISPIHRYLLVSNLRTASAIASTSRAMAKVTHRYWKPEKTYITPFGVDETLFFPATDSSLKTRDVITVGTVKTLSPKYGIDTLLEAFSILRAMLQREKPDMAKRLRLLIVGGGPQEAQLKKMTRELGISEQTEFRGRIPHSLVPQSLRELDIYVALSRLESFGVAILEASASGLPVVVSDADGPREVVVDGKTGFVVPRNDPKAAAAALRRLVLDAELRRRMGAAGRKHVLANYTWEQCVDTMISAYRELVEEHTGKVKQG